jgi:predicted dehydrogenase
MARKERLITSQPLNGEMIQVETPTTIHAVLEFANDAIVTVGMSWDVQAHGHRPMELYGTEASIYVPDPNFFGGDVIVARNGCEPETVDVWDHPFGVPNQERPDGTRLANYRTAGLADMVRSVTENRPARCGLDTALHAVDVMTSILKSGETGEVVEMTTTCAQPAPLGPEEARSLLRD